MCDKPIAKPLPLQVDSVNVQEGLNFVIQA